MQLLKMISEIINQLKLAKQISKAKKTKAADDDEKARIAKLFNDRYCFRKRYVKTNNKIIEGSYYGSPPIRDGFRWMCPECNAIHEPTSCCFFYRTQLSNVLQYTRRTSPKLRHKNKITMQTIDIQEAAQFLKMNEEVLRRKARRHEIPGKKAGKRWIFVKEHLADWISGRYPVAGQNTQVIDSSTGNKTCQSINEIKRGGLDTPRQMEQEYNKVLGLK